MNRRPPCVPVLLLLLALVGCLPDDPPVRGRLLFAGVNIERPEFLYLDDQPWVMFDVRRTRPLFPAGGTADLYMVNWDTGESRALLTARSDRPEWARTVDRDGAFLYMIDERRTSDGPGAAVGTLVRLRITDGTILERVPDVVSYTMHSDRARFHYRKYLPGSNDTELHLREIGREGEGRDRNLGMLTGPVQKIGNLLYFVSGEERALTSVAGFDGEPQVLRKRVSKFLLQEGQRLGLLTVSEANQVSTVIFDIETKEQRPLPIANPCCTIQFADKIYVFATEARGEQPTELHYYNIETDVDRKVTIPGLIDVQTMMRRPPASRGEFLLIDRARQTALLRTNNTLSAEQTPLSPSAPEFNEDGRFLLFIDPDPPPPPPAMTSLPTGRLYAQEFDRLGDAPRLLSPKGSSVPLEPKGFKLRPTPDFPLLFWARYGLGGSDLYISDYETGVNRKVASGIGAVHISDRHVLGVVRITQDLTGDLVYRNFNTGEEKLVEHGVTDVQVVPDPKRGEIVAFVVRERMSTSRRNGLWATLLPSAPEDPTPVPVDMTPTPPPASAGASDSVGQSRRWVRLEGGEPIEREQ